MAEAEQQTADHADPSAALPAALAAPGALDLGAGFSDNLPPSMKILLDPNAFERCKQLAVMMASARGFTPQHLIGNTAACHVVINMALDWKLSPQFVARNTYSTPGGAIGFQGALVQAILNQSGRLTAPVTFEHNGDWSKLTGKFQMVSSEGKKAYPRQTWTDGDAVGLGIRVMAKLRGEAEPRYWPSRTEWFQLVQCQPRNSPLWATDPKTQIAYLAVRRFANQAAPELLGGMPFDVDELLDAADSAIDVTPHQPQTAADHPAATASPWKVFHANGDEFEAKNADVAFEAAKRIFNAAAKQGRRELETAWENNKALIERFTREDDRHGDEELTDLYRTLLADLPAPDPAGKEAAEEEGTAEQEIGQESDTATEAQTIQPAAAAAQAVPPPAAAVADNAERHDPFWDGRSLRIDPPPVRGKPSQLDWKMWPALILPKVRQAFSTAILDEFCNANTDNLAHYGEAAGERAEADLTFEIDLAREALKKAGK